MAWTLAQIAAHVKGDVVGDADFVVDSFADLQYATNNQISFLASSKYRKYLVESQAGAVIIEQSLAAGVLSNAIVVDDAYVAYAKAATLLYPQEQYSGGVHCSATVDESSTIHPTAYIGSQAVIESGVEIAAGVVIGPVCVVKKNSKIGKNTRLSANITICEGVQIGERCLLHPGAVIGADGFGIANDKGRWIKVPQLGSVIVGDDVEIGANTTIDCGAIENTIIANNVKLDNQIHIAHNVIIGENTVIAGCTGIAGSTDIGKNCVIGGRVTINGHISIADGVQLTGTTMVTKSITQRGSYSSGIPAEPTKQWHRNVVRYRQMDALADRVKQLEKQLKNS
ncbi:MAG: UDP-3-O-(3-hydroxymyristoyl)glucosamine N-acyltransferase [Methylophaga sp.]|nr:MAG: UDP-3-O-(3-hydroxymyristoyl)glucosamine N-acyltransferase [Methylophaga sp.]